MGPKLEHALYIVDDVTYASNYKGITASDTKPGIYCGRQRLTVIQGHIFQMTAYMFAQEIQYNRAVFMQLIRTMVRYSGKVRPMQSVIYIH